MGSPPIFHKVFNIPTSLFTTIIAFGGAAGFLSGPLNCISQALSRGTWGEVQHSLSNPICSPSLMQLLKLSLIIGAVLPFRHGWDTMKSKSKNTLQLGLCSHQLCSLVPCVSFVKPNAFISKHSCRYSHSRCIL